LGEKLDNAPLVLVKTRVWWHLYDHQSVENAKLLNGILFSYLKREFKDLKINPSISGNSSTSVFSEDGELELAIQISNSDLTIITTHENYTWEKYSVVCYSIVEYMLSEIHSLWNLDHLHGELEYHDLFNIKENSKLGYLSKLKLDLSSPFIKENDNILIGIQNKESNYFVEYSTYSDSEILVRMKLDSPKLEPSIERIKSWFEESHDFCSEKFKLMIKDLSL